MADPIGMGVVGAWHTEEAGENEAGAAYLFSGLNALDCNGNGLSDACDITSGTSQDADVDGIPDECQLGTTYCSPAVANSTGGPGVMRVLGSTTVADDDLTLRATQLPPQPNIGYFIMGTGMNTFTPPGSAGPICVAPGIRRFLPPVNNTTEQNGGFARTVGTSGPVSGNITPGSTWNFQAWHRDSLAGTSNLTDAVTVDFQ